MNRKSRSLTGTWQAKQPPSPAASTGLPSLNCANPHPPVAAYFFESLTMNCTLVGSPATNDCSRPNTFRCSCRRRQCADPFLAQARCLARRRIGRQELIPAHGWGTPPHEQDISRSIHIPVVSTTALAAYPRSYNEHVQTRRTRQGPAAAACSRCVSLIDNVDASTGLLALIL